MSAGFSAQIMDHPQPKHHQLSTIWTDSVSIEHPLLHYPRPQLRRKAWLDLNGQWQFEPGTKSDNVPFGKTLAENILVPFPMESSLSGIEKYHEYAWYRKQFTIPADWRAHRILLHFGAVMWEATVYVNGQELEVHKGGYTGFTVDISSAIKPGQAEQELIVKTYNPLSEEQVRGKQALKSEGIFYTSASGIWQTVWIEPVENYSISRLKMVPDITKDCLNLNTFIRFDGNEMTKSESNLTIKATVFHGDEAVGAVEGVAGTSLKLPVPHPDLWSPDHPFLYRVRMALYHNNKEVDDIESYVGMRSIALGHDKNGVTRIFLNGKEIFQLGTLDQGYWPDGIYTAPTDDALKSDIEEVKSIGMNVIRKHAKIEPDRWYYWADKLGILVWQDMPQAFSRHFSQAGKGEFRAELAAMITQFENHPSIIVWTLFNESWGQHNTAALTDFIRSMDDSRLIDSASGWNDEHVGDLVDKHDYPGPSAPSEEPHRAAVLGEFGGLGLAIPNHTWSEGWGYKEFKTPKELTEEYVKLIHEVGELKRKNGLCAAIYTQTTDVEQELNGLWTYDRKVFKMDKKAVKDANLNAIHH